MRNMSFGLTVPQIQAGTKDVTRRMGWEFLKVGDLLQPVRKCMGLKPGERIEKLRGPIVVVAVRREPLRQMADDTEYGFEEVRREGFGDHPDLHWPIVWVDWFCASHKGCTRDTIITRIQFAHDGGTSRNA